MDSMTAEATADAALTGRPLLLSLAAGFSFFLPAGVSDGDGEAVVADDDDVVVDLLVLDDDDTVRLGADELARFKPDWLPVWKITNTCDHVRSKKHQVFKPSFIT